MSNKSNEIKQKYKGLDFSSIEKLKKANKKNKFNAEKQIYKGLKFASKKEFHRYLVLEKMLSDKSITDLELQPMYPLMVNGIKIGRYTADFRYKDQSGETIIEDVKSIATKTRDYMMRKKILATYEPPIIITEII